MGCAQSKKSAPTAAEPARRNRDDEFNQSIHGTSRTQRQQLAWHRENVPVTDVYEILEIIGHGSMGEVTIVQRKVDNLEVSEAKMKDLTERSLRETDGTAAAALEASKNAPRSTASRSKEKRKYACKTVNTLRMRDNEMREFINEIDILRDLDHPNIVQLFEVYKVKRKMWIITEICKGGDLTSRKEGMTEPDVVIVLEQILRAISYMHKRNVCHRDIKLENIMYENPDADSPIKLIDFGLSNKFTKGEKMLKACGTIYTAAPELLVGTGYTEQTDIWSIGIVAWVLLSATYPFMRSIEEMKDEAKKEQLSNARYTFGQEWEDRHISKHGKEFVANCLRKHPGARWFASDALEYVEDQWIPYLENLAPSLLDTEEESHPANSATHQGSSSPDGSGQDQSGTESAVSCNGDGDEKEPSPPKRNPLERSVASTKKRIKMRSDVLEGMQSFAEHSELKKTILMTMAYTMDKSSLNELRDLFTVLDSQGTGTITLVDLQNALGQMHSDKHMDDATIEKLFQGIDVDRSGQVHYNEFLAAVAESQGLITMEHLAGAFDRLDSSGKGYISKDDLRNILGGDRDEALVNRMMDEADIKKNGQIDYDEFLRLMFEDPTKGVDAIGRPDLVSNADMTEKLATIEPSRRISFDEPDEEELEQQMRNGDQ